MKKISIICIIPVIMLIAGCASGVSFTQNTLDQAINNLIGTPDGDSGCLMAIIPKGSKIALYYCESPSEKLSLYILDEVGAGLVEKGNMIIVDRAEIDKIHSEFGSSYSRSKSSQMQIDVKNAIRDRLGVRIFLEGKVESERMYFTIWGIGSYKNTYSYSFVSDEFYRSLLGS